MQKAKDEDVLPGALIVWLRGNNMSRMSIFFRREDSRIFYGIAGSKFRALYIACEGEYVAWNFDEKS